MTAVRERIRLDNGIRDATGADIRRHERVSVSVRAVLYRGDRFQTTTVRNFSPGGLGIEGANGLFVGDEVTVVLATGQSRAGVVRWWINGFCGVEFHEECDASCAFIQALARKSNAGSSERR